MPLGKGEVTPLLINSYLVAVNKLIFKERLPLGVEAMPPAPPQGEQGNHMLGGHIYLKFVCSRPGSARHQAFR